MIIGEHNLDFIEGLRVSNKLILSIDDLDIVLVKTLLILLISLLEYNDYEVVIFVLFYDFLGSLHIVNLDLLPRPVLVNVLVIALEADQNVPVLHDFHDLDLILDNPLSLAEILKPEEVLLIGVVQIGLILPPG